MSDNVLEMIDPNVIRQYEAMKCNNDCDCDCDENTGCQMKVHEDSFAEFQSDHYELTISVIPYGEDKVTLDVLYHTDQGFDEDMEAHEDNGGPRSYQFLAEIIVDMLGEIEDLQAQVEELQGQLNG
jgi:hypothetical protein